MNVQIDPILLRCGIISFLPFCPSCHSPRPQSERLRLAVERSCPDCQISQTKRKEPAMLSSLFSKLFFFIVRRRFAPVVVSSRIRARENRKFRHFI